MRGAELGRHRVVVVGAGFGGLWAARALAGSGAHVLLIDQNNYHTFFPLLYQVAAAEIGPTGIAHSVRAILRRSDVQFWMSRLEWVDAINHRLRTQNGWVEYDRLVLALGSVPVYFGVKGAREHAFALRTMDDAVPLRHHVLRQFEEAALSNDPIERRRLLHFVIVGGGPTGVEYAGALAELFYGPLLADFPDVDPGEIEITLVEAGPRLLGGMPDRLGAWALTRLTTKKVNTVLGVAVDSVSAGAVTLNDGRRLRSETVVWTAGVGGAPLWADWGLPTGPGGRIRVDTALRVEGTPDVFAIGDMAYLEQDGASLPLVAQTAMQMGEHAADNIVRSLLAQPLKPFRYRDLGMLAVIGRNAAVADLGSRTFTGFLAWVLWLSIHIVKLIGPRNRALVLVNWAWNYLTFGRAPRLILPGKSFREAAADAESP